jgi:hypothetical protein
MKVFLSLKSIAIGVISCLLAFGVCMILEVAFEIPSKRFEWPWFLLVFFALSVPVGSGALAARIAGFKPMAHGACTGFLASLISLIFFLGFDMEIPEQLWRFPTAEAIASLVSRFQFATDPYMQDPEAELADPERIDEFLAAYETGDMTGDEKFLLMCILLNSFEFSDRPLLSQPQWPRTLALLDRDIAVHIFSVLAFSAPESDPENDWLIGPDMRVLAEKHGAAFGLPGAA